MNKSFQTFLVVGFAAAFVIAVAVFSGLFSKNTTKTSSKPSGQVVIWGVLPRDAMQTYIDNFNVSGAGYTMLYVQHDPQGLYQDLITALANGVQPDLILFNSEIYSQFKDKLAVIPFAVTSERTYRDTYIDGAQLFLQNDGMIGYPLVVDPLVVYYNKDLLAAKNFVVPPVTWNDLTQTIPLFVKRATDGSITQSAIGLGTENNVDHSRDILSALFLQTGDPIVTYNASLKRYYTVLGTSTTNDPTKPSADSQALTFYTSFSDPTSAVYSWNRSLQSSLNQFLAGKSVFYIGRASELFKIQQQNPNLNFDVEELFQPDVNTRHITFGSFYGIGVLKAGRNQIAAYTALTQLASGASIDFFSKATSLPPTRRDLLLVQQNNPYVAIFFKAALGSFAWPDPNPAATESVFSAMITNVTSGKTSVTSALYEANQDIQNEIR
jgi:ABC-type glycerol-3-phosphate transport system substrate-binding protein